MRPSTGWTGWTQLDFGVSSFAVEHVNGTDYVYDLRSSALLMRGQDGPSTGWTGWTQLDFNVASFSVRDVNGTDYVYDLRGSGQLWRGREGLSTGWTGWTQLDFGITSFSVQEVNGTDYVYELRNTGQFWRGLEGLSTGWTGWTQLDFGVTSFSVENVNGTDYVYELRNTGQLWRGLEGLSTGWTGWTQLDFGITTFSIQDVNGTDYVYELRNSGQFWRGLEGLSTGWTGWTQLDFGVTTISVQDVNGTDYVYELRSSGQFWRGLEGLSTGWTGWTQLDGGVAYISVQDLNGTDYVYDLRGSGQLWRGFEGLSTGWTGWTQLDSGVASFAAQDVNGTDYVYDLRRSGQLWRGLEGLSTGWTGWSTFAATSNNWSGYVADVQQNPVASGGWNPQTNVVTYVSGSWVVPKVGGSGTGYSAVWVGIDGNNTQYLEQIGTEEDVVKGKTSYYAWFEMLPQQQTEQVISGMTISPGDSITASVALVSSTASQKSFLLSITDNTTGKSYSTTQTTSASAPAESAEWIVEATTVNGSVATLANFGTATFSAASATIGGFSGPLGSPGWQSTPYNISGTQTDTTSLIAANGMFSVYYGSSAPATTVPGSTPVWITAGTNSSLPDVRPAAPLAHFAPSQADRPAPLGPSYEHQLLDAFAAAFQVSHKRKDALDAIFAE
jgi:hypothetical protein